MNSWEIRAPSLLPQGSVGLCPRGLPRSDRMKAKLVSRALGNPMSSSSEQLPPMSSELVIRDAWCWDAGVCLTYTHRSQVQAHTCTRSSDTHQHNVHNDRHVHTAHTGAHIHTHNTSTDTSTHACKCPHACSAVHMPRDSHEHTDTRVHTHAQRCSEVSPSCSKLGSCEGTRGSLGPRLERQCGLALADGRLGVLGSDSGGRW